jgi:enterochelin esterase-like enzyme
VAAKNEEPARVDRIAGDLITERFDYDGGRQVAVYLPPGPPQAVVFAGDGQLISGWGAYLEASNAPPVMIVGAFRTDATDEMIRLGEYSAPLELDRFAAHEHFFVHDVREWVGSRFGIMPAERTIVCGVSASAEFSLAMGLRHPDLYGTVFAASPGGGCLPPPVLPDRLPRVYLTAGTLEPFFLDNAARWADALRVAGAEVVMSERAGDHGDPFWQAAFLDMLDWTFGP